MSSWFSYIIILIFFLMSLLIFDNIEDGILLRWVLVIIFDWLFYVILFGIIFSFFLIGLFMSLISGLF